MVKQAKIIFIVLAVSLIALLVWLLSDASDPVRVAALSALITLTGASLGFLGSYMIEVHRTTTAEALRKQLRYEEFIWNGLIDLETEIDALVTAVAHLSSTAGAQTKQGSTDFLAQESAYIEQFQRASLHAITMAARLDDAAIFLAVDRLIKSANAFVDKRDGGDIAEEYKAMLDALEDAQRAITARRKQIIGESGSSPSDG